MKTWSWSDLGRSWGGLGRSWVVLGRSWGGLGRSWGGLGRSWGDLGAVLGRSWALFGPLGALLRPLGDLKGSQKAPKIDPKSIKKSIRKSIRNRVGSGTARIALELRLPMFQRGRKVSANQIPAAPKTINPAIDMISSNLSIYLSIYLSIDLPLVVTNHMDRCRCLKLTGSMFCLCILSSIFSMDGRSLS